MTRESNIKDVMIKIVGTQFTDGKEENQMELITEGKLYQRKGKLYLIYEDNAYGEGLNQRTRLTLDGDVVRMTRYGQDDPVDTEIRFKKGERFSGVYGTPYGVIDLEVLTNSLENSVTEEGEGKIVIDYDISLKGLSEGRSKLNVEVNRKM